MTWIGNMRQPKGHCFVGLETGPKYPPRQNRHEGSSAYFHSLVFLLSATAMLLLMIGCASTQSKPPVVIKDEGYDISKTSWNRYRPATLGEIKEHLSHFPEKFVGMTVNAEAASKPYRINAGYLSEFRRIPQAKLQLLKDWWGGMFNVPGDFTKLFEHEVLIQVETDQYWMPVQSPVIPYLQKELQKGDRVWLYIMAVGSLDYEESHDWVFIINEFQKP